MNKFAKAVKDILLFPERLDCYSAFVHAVNSNHAEKVEEKLPDNHPIPSLSILLLLIIFIVLSMAVMIQTAGSVEKAIVVALIILGVGLLAGSIHTSLGVIAVLFGIALSFQNSRIASLSNPAMSFLLPGITVLFLPAALYLQRLSHAQHAPKRQYGRLLFGLAISAAGLYFAQLSSKLFNDSGYAWTVLLLAYVLAAPVKKRKGKEENYEYSSDVVSKIGLTVYFVLIFLGLIGIGKTWFGGLAVWLKFILYPVLIIFGMTILQLPVTLPSFVASLSLSEKDPRPVFCAEKRWLLLLFYLGFQSVLEPTLAFFISLFVLLVFSLSFVSLNRLQTSVSFPQFSIAQTAAGVVWFYVVSVLIVDKWYFHLADILRPSFSVSIALLVFVLIGLIFTTAGRHWSWWVGGILGTLLVIYAAGSSLLSIPVWLGFGAGVLLGYSRILLWPVLSILFRRQLGVVRGPRGYLREKWVPAIELIEINCWPPPLGRMKLLSELALHGLTEYDLQDNASKRLLHRARERLAENLLGADFTLEDLSGSSLIGVTPALAENIGLLASISKRGTPVLEKYKVYATVINNLVAKQEADKKSVSSKLRPYEQKALQRLIDLSLADIKIIQNDQQDFFDRLSKANKPAKKIKPLATISALGESEFESIEKQNSEVLTAILEFTKSFRILEPDLENLPKEEKQIYFELIGVGNTLSNLDTIRFDYPAQQKIIQSTMESLERISATVSENWSILNSDLNGVATKPNPWHSSVGYVLGLLQELLRLVDLRIKCVERILVDQLVKIDQLEALAALQSTLERLTGLGEKYGFVLDETLTRLDIVSKEAASALAFPKGYNRRLGVQDTLDRLNELRSLLTTRFLAESKEIAEPLGRLSKWLFDSLYETSEEKAAGFRNPYITGNPIRLSRSALFKGRLELVKSMVVAMRSRSNPTFVLHGPRRMGKTSFLLQLPRLLPAQYVPVYVDMQEGGAQSDAQFLYSLANAIYRQTKKSLHVEKPDFSTFEAHPFVAINDWLDILYPQIENRSLFFTIDEFEVIGKAISQGTITPQVLDYLRHLMQHNENMILLFAGVQTIDALGPNPASYFISAYPIEISYLPAEDAKELICNPDPLAGNMPTYDGDVVKAIIELTHCQPYLIQAICSEIIGIANEKALAHIQRGALDEAVNRVLSTSLYFRNIWDDARIEGQHILKQVINNSDVRFTPEMAPCIGELVYKHILCKKDSEKYAIEIPLVEMWIQKQQ